MFCSIDSAIAFYLDGVVVGVVRVRVVNNHLGRLLRTVYNLLMLALILFLEDSSEIVVVLERLSLGEHFLLDLSTDNSRWRLESLNLHVEPGDKQRTSMSLLTSKLFCLASPTLKSLTWASSFNLHSNSVVRPPDLGTGRPAFRCLQELHVDTLTRYHPSWLDILIQPGGMIPLRSLEIDICKNEAVMEFFCNCGYLPNLEVFVWRAIGFGMKNTSLAFLQANCHIRKLMVQHLAFWRMRYFLYSAAASIILLLWP